MIMGVNMMNILELGITQVAAITVICYLIGVTCKAIGGIDKFIPCIVGASGGILGVVAMFVMPEFIATDVLSAIAVGIVSGLGSTGAHQVVHQLVKEDDTE